MTRDDLESNGYKYFKDMYRKSNGGYQKRIYSENGTRYFINVYYYDFSTIPNLPFKELFDCDLQFKVRGEYLNLDFNCRDLTIKQLESKVEWLFTTLGAEDYE